MKKESNTLSHIKKKVVIKEKPIIYIIIRKKDKKVYCTFVHIEECFFLIVKVKHRVVN